MDKNNITNLLQILKNFQFNPKLLLVKYQNEQYEIRIKSRAKAQFFINRLYSACFYAVQK